MDANQLMDDIDKNASAVGMTLTEYIAANYDKMGLDDIQAIVSKGLSDNRGKINKFRRENNIKREKMDLSGMDSLSLDLMQADVYAKMEAAKADYTEIEIIKTGKESVFV